MTRKISKEDLISFIDGECDKEIEYKIKNALKNDINLNAEYKELKNLRMTQAETMLPLLNKKTPVKIEQIINGLTDKKSNIGVFFKLSPIAIIGWLGFATVGSIQVATLNTPALLVTAVDDNISQSNTFFEKEDLKNFIKNMESELESRRKLSNDGENRLIDEFLENQKMNHLNKEKLNTDYSFTLNKIYEEIENICIDIQLVKNSEELESKKVCFKKENF
tara:strand:+ start:1301 stop:1963 length:663 start_codon:yes stop_codon:yes gene_type:complete